MIFGKQKQTQKMTKSKTKKETRGGTRRNSGAKPKYSEQTKTDGNMKRAGLQSTNLSNRTNFKTRENK